ncbi:DUF4124 domain-containing protein [Fluoribacter gormanii]|uniref:DUF4124 domain-containing protein n=1 Tax=Fluoribacter gormanii TaxID=464 RepID=A0A377GKC1_9GAMM|nr:DUF4124 domain-containing protein [Fluoribacter gormanii]KTD00828.1 hypothetical protein Lgor_2745 [Fluoribacter gormanii]MCW8443477.1 DUF4124 domain-containing protein [Fluoribacter gormanii]MCW8471905.1 DUF4124 domain-containing protein [Fluoribacter gormanii]SIQ79056.1 protein of unknown function [Fluoribacter gormanii]STO24975.1 Uncharacterised protein [Fluoribacter gormanii]
MNKFFVSLSLMMVICASYAAQIYRWTDSQGNVHFSDTPHEGAEIVTIPDSQSFSSPAPSNSQTSTQEPEQTDHNDTVKLKHSYTTIAIAEPANGATVRNNQGFVMVTAQIEPDLHPGDKLQLLYDDVALGEPQTNITFEINGMYRGSHSLAVQVLDAEGNVIDKSEAITIYVFRPRVGMVPGTAPR